MLRRVLLIGLVLLAILIATPVVVVVSVQRSGASALEQARQRWEPLGGVPDFAAMRPAPIPDDRNAAVIYAHIYDLMKPVADAHRTHEEERPFADAICREPALIEIIDLAEKAAARPECVWESTWFDEGFDALLPHVGSARTLAHVLAAAAECRLNSGDTEGAARAIRAGIVLGSNAAASEPSIITALVASSIHNLLLDKMQDLFRDHELPAGHEIDRVLEEIDYGAMLRRCLTGETAVGLDALERHGADEVPGVFVFTGWSFKGDTAHYLDLMRHAIEQLDTAPGLRDWSPFERERAVKTMLTHLIAPAIHVGVNNALLVEATLLLAREAIKLREHRAQHGSYPAAWTMPTDPVTGAPLHYQRENDGFIMWSEAEVREGRERIQWHWR